MIAQGWVSRGLQLLLLAAAALFGTFVRAAIGPLQEAMRTSLELSDNQVSLLQGMAMAVPLALASIPLGVLNDRRSRRLILLGSMTCALLASVLSALATDFAELAAARCLLGLAVPGIMIAAYAMAGDMFDPAQRGRATMVVGIGETCGAPVAFALGGVLLHSFATAADAGGVSTSWLQPWNWSLLTMSGALLPLLLMMLLLREPKRSHQSGGAPPLRAVWRQLVRFRSVAIPLQLARATLFIAEGAVFVWGAPLLSRQFSLSPDRVGVIMATALLVAGLLSPMLGGPLVDFCSRSGGPRRAMWVFAWAALSTVPFALFALVPHAATASVMLAVFLTIAFTIAMAALTLTLIVIPSELRGLNLGISAVVGSVFFVGLAPLAVSVLATAMGGESMLPQALATVCATAGLVNAAVFAFSARYFPGVNDYPGSSRADHALADHRSGQPDALAASAANRRAIHELR